MGSRADLKAVARRKEHSPCRESNPSRPACSVYYGTGHTVYIVEVYGDYGVKSHIRSFAFFPMQY
jgi:hypothetical protein